MIRSRLFIVAFFIFFAVNSLALAQDVVTVGPIETQCGAALEGELVDPFEQHVYTIELAPGDTIRAQGAHVGDQLRTSISLIDSENRLVTATNFNLGRTFPNAQPTMDSGVVSARGTYKLFVRNYPAKPVNGEYSYGSATNKGSRGTGIYFLYVSCTLRDGTVINPGETLEPVSVQVTESETAPISSIPDFGFMGLSPVDFYKGVTIPLNFEAPNVGSIPPGFDSIFGYNFNGNAGDSIGFQFTRNGNINLGIAIIAEDNTLIFQSIMTASDFILTQFILPTSSSYTIGVFSFDGTQPVDAQSTSFEITVTLNELIKAERFKRNVSAILHSSSIIALPSMKAF